MDERPLFNISRGLWSVWSWHLYFMEGDLVRGIESGVFVMKLTEQDIDNFIRYFDEETKYEYCAYPDGQQLDCQDCSLCRHVLYEEIRNDLRQLDI